MSRKKAHKTQKFFFLCFLCRFVADNGNYE